MGFPNNSAYSNNYRPLIFNNKVKHNPNPDPVSTNFISASLVFGAFSFVTTNL